MQILRILCIVFIIKKGRCFSVAVNLSATARKLLMALNCKGCLLTMGCKQFIGKDARPHNYYSVNQATWNSEKDRYDHHELYSSASMIRIVLYLRDLLYILEDKELPTDNEMWNKIRAELEAKANG